MDRDPVCKMQVDEQQAEAKGLTSEFRGETFHFCSASCKRQFDQNPERYAGERQADRPRRPAG